MPTKPSMNVTNPAILLFIRPEPVEFRLKTLSSHREVNELLFNKLNLRLIHEAKKTGYPVIIATEQIGKTFQERFLNAVSEGFDHGFDGLILVGNDTPLQKSTHFLTAIYRLQSDGVVLGKSTDGGAWLIGVNREKAGAMGNPSIRWQTKDLFSDLVNVLGLQPERLNDLPILSDLDSRHDFNLFLRLQTVFEEFQSILHVLSTIFNFDRFRTFIKQNLFAGSSLHRGPPVTA